MLQLMQKIVTPEMCEILYDRPFTSQSVEQDFLLKSGKWHVDEDGWLCGENPENNPGMIISKADYFGPVLLEVDCATVLPSTHDINVMWHGSWNDDIDKRHVAYVAGIQGWWDGKVGFEKSPDYSFCCGTQLFPFEPGRVYHLTVGDDNGHIFVAIDGKLVLEIKDPNPIDNHAYGRIGFEAYCSKIKFKNLKIRHLDIVPSPKHYTPEF